jgi:hypothetical protein
MTDYRMVTRHVGYWRGANHRFSNVWRFSGTLASGDYATAIAAMKTLEQGVHYIGAALTGGLWKIDLYNQGSGGIPVASSIYFDPDTTASWVAYTATAWASHTPLRNSVLEAAAQVTWLAGVSSTGKPVRFRKWFHSVPINPASAPAAEITTADQTSIQNLCQTQLAVIAGLGAPQGIGGRLAATTAVCDRFYVNHQMPRGRRNPLRAALAGTLYRGQPIRPVIPD